MTLTGGGLYTFLTAHAGLAALVGTRIYPRRWPRNPVFPLVAYRRISTHRELTHSGPSDLADPRIQFDVVATDPDTADAVAEQLRLALHGYRGAMGDVPVGSVRVVNDLDDEHSDTGLYRRIVDAEISHREAVA